MIILGDDVRVDFTPIERSQLTDALTVTTRLYSNLSSESQETTDFGLSANSVNEGITYLLANGGIDNSLEIASMVDPVIIDATLYSALSAAKTALYSLINNEISNDYYLNLDLEVETYVPTYVKLHEIRNTTPFSYKLEFGYFINNPPTGVSASWQVINNISYAVDANFNPTWTSGTGSANFTFYDISGETPALVSWANMNITVRNTLTAAAVSYCTVLTGADFIPSESYNWINKGNSISDEAQSVYNALNALLPNYESDVEPVVPTGEYKVTFAWTSMPEGSYTFTLYNGYTRINITMTHDNDSAGISYSDEITLPIYKDDEDNEFAYEFDTSSIGYDIAFAINGTPITSITSANNNAQVNITSTAITYTLNWAYHNFVYESNTWEDDGYPEGADPLYFTLYHEGSDVGVTYAISEGNTSGSIILNEAGNYTIGCNAHLSINSFTASAGGSGSLNIYQYNEGDPYNITVNSSVVTTYLLDGDEVDIGVRSVDLLTWNGPTDNVAEHIVPHELDATAGYKFSGSTQVIEVTSTGTYTIITA